jgi:hypothetical protein
MRRLGFDTATITPHLGGVYTVQITGFKPTGPALSLPGKFRPFKLSVKPVKGKLYIDHECLIKERYNVKVRSIPGGSPIIMRKVFRKYLGTSNHELSQINSALAVAKDYKMRGLIKIANVLNKSRIVESLIDDCSVPNPSSDIPKIRVTLNQLGLQTGNIQLEKGRIYKINITGASPDTKLKFVSGIFKPFVLDGMFIKGILYIAPKSWNASIKTDSGIEEEVKEAINAAKEIWEAALNIPPLFAIQEPREIIDDYHECSERCSCYIDNAHRAKQKAQMRYEFLESVLREVERVRDHVEDRCARITLTDSHKTALYRSLNRLVDQAERQKDRFDRYIEDIERFIEKYNACKVNEPISP